MEDQLMQDHFKEIFDAASSHRTKEEEQPGYLFRRMGLTVEDENPPADAPDFTVDDLPSQPIRPVQNTYLFNPQLHTGVFTKENKYPLASEKPTGFVKKITDASIAGLQDIPAMAQGVRDAGETVAQGVAKASGLNLYRGYGLLTKDKTALENYAKIEDALFGAMNKARQERNLTAQEMAAEQAARSGEAANTVLAQAVRSFVPMALTMGAAGAAMKAANIEQAAARMYLTHVGAGYEGLQSGSAIQSEILASGGSGEKALAYGAVAGVAVGATGKLPLEAMLLENKGLWAPILKHMDSLPKVLTTVGGEWMRGFATEVPTGAIQAGIEETTRVAAGVSQASLGDIGSAMGTEAWVSGLSGAGTGAVLSTLNFTAETKATVMQQASIAALATVEHHGNPNAKAKMDKAIEKGAQAFTDVGVPADVARKILVTYKDHIVKTQLQGIADVLKTPETVQLSPTAAYMNAENAKAKRVNSIQQRVEMLVDPVAAAQLTPIQDASPDDLARILENTKFVEEKAGKRTAAVAAPTERVQKLLAAKQTSLLKDMKAVQAEYEAADTALKLAAKEDEANSKAKKVAYEPTDAEIDAKLGDEATKKKTETLEAYEARIDKATERAVKELKAEAKKNAKAYAPKADAANAKLEEVSKRMAGLHAQLTRLMTGEVTVVSDGEKADVDIDAKPTREQNKDKELKVLAGKVREAVESTDKKKKGLLKSSFDALTGWLQSQSLPDEVTNHIDAIASKAIAEAGTLTPELVSQFEAAVESARKAQITEMYREEIKAQYERTDKSVAEMRLWYREQAVAEDIRGAYDQILRLPEEQRLEVARQAVDAYRASLGVAQDPRYDATNRAMSQFLTTPYSTESRAWVDNMAAVRYLTDNPNTAGYLTADELSTASNMIQQLNVVGKKNLQRILGGKKADITREVALPFLNAMKAGISSMAQDLKVTDKLDTWSRASNSALRMAKSFTTYGSSGKGLFRFPIEALKDLVPNMPGRDAWFERYLNANSSERYHELLIQEFFEKIGDVYGAKTRDDITKIMDRDGEYDKVNVSTNRVLDNGGKLELTFNRAQLRTVTMYWMQPDVKPMLEEVMGLTDEKLRDAWESISGGISAEDMGYMNKTAKMYEELFNRINDAHIQLTGTSINKVEYYTRLYRRTFTTLTDPTSAADRAADRNAFMPGETADRVHAAVADIDEDEGYMRQVLRGTKRNVNKAVAIGELKARTGGSQMLDIRPDYQIAYDYAMDVSKFIAFTPLVQNLVAVYETMNNESLQNASKQEGGGTTPKQYEFLRKLSEAFGYTEEQARMQLELVRSVAVSRGMTTDEFLDKNIADIKTGKPGDEAGLAQQIVPAKYSPGYAATAAESAGQEALQARYREVTTTSKVNGKTLRHFKNKIAPGAGRKSFSEFFPTGRTGVQSYPLSDVVSHADLFVFFPGLKNATVTFSSVEDNAGKAPGATFDAGSSVGIRIVRDLSRPRENTEVHYAEVLEHEVQHAMQMLHGVGPTAAAVRPGQLNTPEGRQEYYNDPGELQARQTRMVGADKLSQDRRAQVEFLADGKALITAFEKPDFSSFIHEFAHVARRNVLTPTEMDIAAKWAGVEKGIWTQEAEEKWAKAVEKYLMEREAPKGGILTAIFAKIKKFLSDVYAKISKEYFKGITVSPELKTVLDGLFPQNAVQVGGMELATDNLIAATNIAGPNVKKVLDAVKNITRNYIDVLSNGDSVDPLLKSKAGSTFIGVTATMMVSSLGQLFVQSSSVIPGLILADVSRSKGYLAQLPNALKALFAQNDPLMTAIRASEFMKNRFEGKMSRETEIIRQLMHKANDPTLTEKERRAFIEKNAPRVMKLMTLGVRHGDMFASSLVAYSVAKAEMANGMGVGAAMAQGEKVVSDTQQSSDAHKNLGLARSGNFVTQALMLFTQTGFIMSNAVQDMNRDYSKGVITATQWAKGVVAIVGLSGMLEVLLRGLDPEDEKLARKSPKWFALRFLASGFANTPFLGPVMNAAGNAVVGSALLYEGGQQEDAETRAIGRAFMRSVPTALGRTGLTLQGLIGYWAQTANRTVVSATESKKAFDMLSGVIDSGDQTDEETMRMAYGYAIDATWQASKMFIPSTPAPAMALPIVNYVSAGLQTLNQMAHSGELSRAGQELLMASIFMGAIKGESVKKLEARHKVAEDANNS